MEIQSHMNNDLANSNLLTGLLVEMATVVKLRHCESIRQPTKSILYYKYSQESHDLTCWFHMWPDLPKGVLYTYSFRSHFSWSFDRNNNRLTVHACTIAKASTVCFNWGLIHGLVWHPQVLGRSVNGSNLPGQADSQQESLQDCSQQESLQDWLVRLGIDLATFWDLWSWKQPELKPFGHKTVLYWKFLPFHGSPPPPPSTPIVMLVVLTALWNKLSKMAGISTSYPLKSPSTEWSWITID